MVRIVQIVGKGMIRIDTRRAWSLSVTNILYTSLHCFIFRYIQIGHIPLDAQKCLYGGAIIINMYLD
jgi:hypothetical protein